MDTAPRARGMNAHELLLNSLPKEGVGNAGCPLHPQPQCHGFRYAQAGGIDCNEGRPPPKIRHSLQELSDLITRKNDRERIGLPRELDLFGSVFLAKCRAIQEPQRAHNLVDRRGLPAGRDQM